MESELLLIWGMLFGSIGLGYFVYGKRQKAIVPLLTGIALFIFPYFISDAFILVGVGLAIMAAPYFISV